MFWGHIERFPIGTISNMLKFHQNKYDSQKVGNTIDLNWLAREIAFRLGGWRIGMLHFFCERIPDIFFIPKKIVFLFLAKRMRKNRVVAANDFGANCRQYYANYIFEHTERRTRKWKRHSFDLLQPRLLDGSMDMHARIDGWIASRLMRSVMPNTHTDIPTNKIIIIMMNDATMWPKRIAKVILVVIMSWHNVFSLPILSPPFSCLFRFALFFFLFFPSSGLPSFCGTEMHCP